MPEKFDINNVLDKMMNIGIKSNSNETLANAFTKKLKLKKPQYDVVTSGLRQIEQEDKNRYLEILDLVYPQIDTDTKEKLKSKLNQ